VLSDQVLHLANVLGLEPKASENFPCKVSAALRVIATANVFANVVQQRSKEDHLRARELGGQT
jgi:hypothetical protein